MPLPMPKPPLMDIQRLQCENPPKPHPRGRSIASRTAKPGARHLTHAPTYATPPEPLPFPDCKNHLTQPRMPGAYATRHIKYDPPPPRRQARAYAYPAIHNPSNPASPSPQPRVISRKPHTHPPNSPNLHSGYGGDYDTENKPPCIPVLLLTSSVAQDCRAALTRLWRERYQMRAKMSRPTSSVVRLVDPSSAISASTARSIFAAASSNPRWRRSIALDSTAAVGLAIPLPAISGADPWIGPRGFAPAQ